MSTFTDAELTYLAAQPIMRFASASLTGKPDVVPVVFSVDGDDIVSGGFDITHTVRYRNILANPRATVVIDDLASMDPWSPRGLKIMGSVTVEEADGSLRLNSYGRPGQRILLCRADQAVLHDTWNTIGLRGTASDSYSFDDVFVPDDYVVGELNKGFQYISEALDIERFTLFTYSPTAQRLDLRTEYVKGATRDGEPLKDDAQIRAQLAHLHTEAEVARVLGLQFVAASLSDGPPPTSEASEYKLFTTEFSRRLANASMDISGAGGQLRVHSEEAPMVGRSESTYRYTVIDTIGGGASEVMLEEIAKRFGAAIAD